VIKAARKKVPLATVHSLAICLDTSAKQREEGEDSEKALVAFETEVGSEERERFVATFAEREFPHGFFPPRNILHRLAAVQWVARKAQPEGHVATA
jgi:hypothetical protein